MPAAKLSTRAVHRLVGLVAAVLLLTACTDADEPADGADDEVDEAAEAVVPAEGTPACEVDDDLPCSFAEVDHDVLADTDTWARLARVVQHEFGTAAAAEVLAAQEEVAEVTHDARTLRFRLDGGRHAWVSETTAGDEPLLGAGSVATAATAATAAPAATTGTGGAPGTPPADDGALLADGGDGDDGGGGSGGVTGESAEGKGALVASPLHWEFAPVTDDDGDGFVETVASELLEGRDWIERGGGVDVRANEEPFAEEVREGAGGVWDDDIDEALAEARSLDLPTKVESAGIETFTGWDEYDAVFVKTHGYRICDDEAETGVAETSDDGAENADDEEGDADGEGVCEDGETGLVSGDGILLPTDADEVAESLAATFDDAHLELAYAGSPILDEPELSESCERAITDDDGDLKPAGEIGAADATRCATDLGLPRADIVLTPDWFRAQYPDGLGDTIALLAACEGMRHGDYDHLVGDDGLLVGFRSVVSVHLGVKAAEAMVASFAAGEPASRTLAAVRHHLRGEPVRMIGPDGDEEVLDEWTLSHGDDPDAIVVDSGADGLDDTGDEALRGRDVVSARHPDSGEEFADGDAVEVVDGDDGPALSVTLRVQGIEPEAEPIDAFELRAEIDGEPVDERWSLDEQVDAGGDVVDSEVWETEAQIPLGEDADEPFELLVASSLPRGGETAWRYEDLEPAEAELAITARLAGLAQGGVVWEQTLEGEIELDGGPDAGTWEASPREDWARHEWRHDPAPVIPLAPPHVDFHAPCVTELDSTSRLEVPRVTADPGAGTAEVDLGLGGIDAEPPVADCRDAEPLPVFYPEIELFVVAGVVAMGQPVGQLEHLDLRDVYDLVGPDTVRFSDWERTDDGALVHEHEARVPVGEGEAEGHLRLELRVPDEDP